MCFLQNRFHSVYFLWMCLRPVYLPQNRLLSMCFRCLSLRRTQYRRFRSPARSLLRCLRFRRCFRFPFHFRRCFRLPFHFRSLFRFRRRFRFPFHFRFRRCLRFPFHFRRCFRLPFHFRRCFRLPFHFRRCFRLPFHFRFLFRFLRPVYSPFRSRNFRYCRFRRTVFPKSFPLPEQ